VAKKYMIVPAPPVAPAAAARQPAPAPGSRRFPVTAAATPATTTSASPAAATGHSPLPDPARFSPMNSRAKQAPATRPSAAPAAGLPCPPAWSPRAALADTPTMAGSARIVPARARADGRSPSPSPASTENPAAPTALSGPATLNAACLNPRYSAKAPTVPATPASTPQASAAAAGR